MTEKIICAGFGGQGIMAMGKVLALSALSEGRQVSWLPAYGAEVRGGTAHCMVVISDEKIASPCVELADTLIIMNGPSLKKFAKMIRARGLLLVNSSMVEAQVTGTGADIFEVPMTQMAQKLGLDKIANTIAIGAYLAKRKLIPLAAMQKSIAEVLAHRQDLIALNKRALEAGYNFVRN